MREDAQPLRSTEPDSSPASRIISTSSSRDRPCEITSGRSRSWPTHHPSSIPYCRIVPFRNSISPLSEPRSSSSHIPVEDPAWPGPAQRRDWPAGTGADRPDISPSPAPSTSYNRGFWNTRSSRHRTSRASGDQHDCHHTYEIRPLAGHAPPADALRRCIQSPGRLWNRDHVERPPTSVQMTISPGRRQTWCRAFPTPTLAVGSGECRSDQKAPTRWNR